MKRRPFSPLHFFHTPHACPIFYLSNLPSRRRVYARVCGWVRGWLVVSLFYLVRARVVSSCATIHPPTTVTATTLHTSLKKEKGTAASCDRNFLLYLINTRWFASLARSKGFFCCCGKAAAQQQSEESSPAQLSTPVNTPVATRPESPVLFASKSTFQRVFFCLVSVLRLKKAF